MSNGHKSNPPISWGRLIKINPTRVILERNGKWYKRKTNRLCETPEEAVSEKLKNDIRKYIKEVERKEMENLLSPKQQEKLKNLGVFEGMTESAQLSLF